jgi:hypothetical protein
MVEKTKQNGKATVVITYNSVAGYPEGTYQGKEGPVVIYSNDNTSSWDEQAENKLGNVMHGIYGRITPEDVGQVYLYVGLHARNGALRAAESLAGKGNKLTLVACDCRASQKKETAERLNVPIIWSDCGGRRTLQNIVENALR